MIKKLTKHGNSYALVIEKPVMELLNIGADTVLKVSTNGKKLTIEPMNEESKSELGVVDTEEKQPAHA